MKKIYFLFLTVAMIFALTPVSFAAGNDDSRIQSIQELYKQKSALLATTPIDQTSIDNINQKLKKLGVEFLTQEQVDAKARQAAATTTGIQPMIAVPTQSNIVWSSYRDTMVVSGVNYEVQHLIAEPNGQSSNLRTSGVTAVNSSGGLQAGTLAMIGSGSTSVAGAIPGVGTVLSVYDALKSFYGGLQRTSTISDIQVSYTYSATTTVTFLYVKKVGQSDDSQILSYICNLETASVTWVVPSFTSDVTGAVHPVNTTGTNYLSAVGAGYDVSLNAINAYISPYAPKTGFITTFRISGPESKTVVNLYPLVPSYPSQVG